MEKTLEYPYRVRGWAVVFSVACTATATAVLLKAAWTNDRGLSVLLPEWEILPVGAATGVYWLMAGLASMLLVLVMMVIVREKLLPLAAIRLTDSELWLPKIAFTHAQTIALRDIEKVEVGTFQYLQKYLLVKSRRGAVTIWEWRLPERRALYELYDALVARTQAHRAPAP
jgi:hypothetical protein